MIYTASAWVDLHQKKNNVCVADVLFAPAPFAHVKEAQIDMLHNAYALEYPMVV